MAEPKELGPKRQNLQMNIIVIVVTSELHTDSNMKYFSDMPQGVNGCRKKSQGCVPGVYPSRSPRFYETVSVYVYVRGEFSSHTMPPELSVFPVQTKLHNL